MAKASMDWHWASEVRIPEDDGSGKVFHVVAQTKQFVGPIVAWARCIVTSGRSGDETKYGAGILAKLRLTIGKQLPPSGNILDPAPLEVPLDFTECVVSPTGGVATVALHVAGVGATRQNPATGLLTAPPEPVILDCQALRGEIIITYVTFIVLPVDSVDFFQEGVLSK